MDVYLVIVRNEVPKFIRMHCIFMSELSSEVMNIIFIMKRLVCPSVTVLDIVLEFSTGGRNCREMVLITL